MAKERGSRVKRRGLEEKRAQVIRLIEAGTHPDVVAAAFGVGRSTVYGWWFAYRQKGEESFVVKKSSGGKTKLSVVQIAKLRSLIVDKTPVSCASTSRSGPVTWSGPSSRSASRSG